MLLYSMLAQVIPLWFVDVFGDSGATDALVQEQSALVRLLVEAGELEPRPWGTDGTVVS